MPCRQVPREGPYDRWAYCRKLAVIQAFQSAPPDTISRKRHHRLHHIHTLLRTYLRVIQSASRQKAQFLDNAGEPFQIRFGCCYDSTREGQRHHPGFGFPFSSRGKQVGQHVWTGAVSGILMTHSAPQFFPDGRSAVRIQLFEKLGQIFGGAVSVTQLLPVRVGPGSSIPFRHRYWTEFRKAIRSASSWGSLNCGQGILAFFMRFSMLGPWSQRAAMMVTSE